MNKTNLISILIVCSIFVISCSPSDKNIKPIDDKLLANIGIYLSNSSYCEQNSDCVSENSCRPQLCVNKYFAEQNPVTACCTCENCVVCISCGECVNNQCKTNIVGKCC